MCVYKSSGKKINRLARLGLGAFIIVAFVFRSFLLHCHAEVRSISSIAERDASCLSMTKATILNAPLGFASVLCRASPIKIRYVLFLYQLHAVS